MSEIYSIRVKGHLDDHWSAWFDGLTITNEANGDALLCGPIADQAALHGVLIKVRDLGLPLLALNRLEDPVLHSTLGSGGPEHSATTD
jgi:hypothetical protein